MDIITQLQDQVNKIAFLAFNSVGTLQRDAPSARLSNNYPQPPPAPVPALTPTTTAPSQEIEKDDASAMASALIQAAKQFDALVAALPIAEGGSEEAQMKRIAELQAENDEIGKELRRELDAADEELKQVRELFHKTADDCFRFKQLQ